MNRIAHWQREEREKLNVWRLEVWSGGDEGEWVESMSNALGSFRFDTGLGALAKVRETFPQRRYRLHNQWTGQVYAL